jgi:class 3 adenylate cyclase
MPREIRQTRGRSGKLARMARCAACGAENPGGARFCNSCGSQLAAPTPERRKLVTAVFCDVSGSTALAERVDAEAVFGLMRSYFESARAALERHGGSVEKFIGDAVVGMFGVPEAHEDDALRACRAALEIRDEAARLGIAVRIGVNTGEVVTGEVGGRAMFASGDAVVLGDAVNVAARLEQAAESGEVLIGEPTWRLVRDAAVVEAREPVQAKGKAEPVVAYRVLGVTAPGQPPRLGAAPLAGRDDELAALVGAFEDVVAEGHCRLVTVVGEPGIGKSRLASELIERVGAQARVARGACLSYGEGITYWAIGQAVRELVGIREEQSLEEARAVLDASLAGSPDGEAVASQIAQLLGLASGSTTPQELAWAVRRFLAAAAGAEPLIVVIDDIQWAERVLLDLLGGLPAALQGEPVLVLCLARPELLERDPDWPVAVRLAPLGPGAVESLLAGLGAPDRLRERLAAGAAGNPLFAEELVAWLGEGGDLDEMPAGLNALLGARLDRLDPEERDALERGAVEGEVFHHGAVVELSEERARPAIAGELSDLTRRDLIIRLAAAGLAGEVAYRFKHLLVRDAAYRATAKRLRAALHEQFADWLERRAGARVGEYREILGYHLEQAYRYRVEVGSLDEETVRLGERAAAHLADAARRAEALSDYGAVTNLLERALAVGFAEPHVRVRVQAELGSGLVFTRRADEADAVLTEAHETAVRLGERGLAAGALVRRGWNRTGDPRVSYEEHQAACEEAILTLTEVGDERGLSEARRLLGLSFSALGREEEARSELELAVAHAEACGDSELRRNSVNTLVGLVYIGGPTPVAEGIALCEQLLSSAAGQRVHEATLRRSLGVLYAMAARPAEAFDALALGAAVLDEVRLRHLEVHRWPVGYARRLCGDRDGAEREYLMIWDYFRDIRGDRFDNRAWRAANALASLYCDEGRFADAAPFHAYGRDEGRAGLGQNAEWLSVEARVAAHEGRFDDAAELAALSAQLSETWLAPTGAAECLAAAARLQRRIGLTDEADRSAARAFAFFDRKGNIAGAARLRAALAQPV